MRNVPDQALRLGRLAQQRVQVRNVVRWLVRLVIVALCKVSVQQLDQLGPTADQLCKTRDVLDDVERVVEAVALRESLLASAWVGEWLEFSPLSTSMRTAPRHCSREACTPMYGPH